VDDLGELIKEGVQARQDAVLQAEAIIDHGVQNFLQWKESRQQVPVIRALTRHAEEVEAGEMALAKKRLARGDDIESVLKSLAHGLSQKYLHGAYSQLHHMGHLGSDEREQKTELIRDLFGLHKNTRDH
jgi:glutamyl-tRNA reductase